MREVSLNHLGYHIDELLYLLGVGGVGKVFDPIELYREIWEDGLAYLEVDFRGGEDSLILDPSFDS